MTRDEFIRKHQPVNYADFVDLDFQEDLDALIAAERSDAVEGALLESDRQWVSRIAEYEAAAREEQRKVDARLVAPSDAERRRFLNSDELPTHEYDDYVDREEHARKIREAPLTDTPLADRIRELEAAARESSIERQVIGRDLDTALARVKELEIAVDARDKAVDACLEAGRETEQERDEARARVQEMGERLASAFLRVKELEAQVEWGDKRRKELETQLIADRNDRLAEHVECAWCQRPRARCSCGRCA